MYFAKLTWFEIRICTAKEISSNNTMITIIFFLKTHCFFFQTIFENIIQIAVKSLQFYQQQKNLKLWDNHIYTVIDQGFETNEVLDVLIGLGSSFANDFINYVWREKQDLSISYKKVKILEEKPKH